jgi:hypothetical protein
MRPSELTATASVKMRPAPPIARAPRWTRCQSVDSPSPASQEYWHIGETTTRLRRHTSRSGSGWSRRGRLMARQPLSQAGYPNEWWNVTPTPALQPACCDSHRRRGSQVSAGLTDWRYPPPRGQPPLLRGPKPLTRSGPSARVAAPQDRRRWQRCVGQFTIGELAGGKWASIDAGRKRSTSSCSTSSVRSEAGCSQGYIGWRSSPMRGHDGHDPAQSKRRPASASAPRLGRSAKSSIRLATEISRQLASNVGLTAPSAA